MTQGDRIEQDERLADVGRGITLCWSALGDPADPPLLLIAGLGQQLVGWPPELSEALAAEGFHVIRFDNRDSGRSTSMAVPPPTTGRLLTRRFAPEQYTLEDMADDAAGLLDALGLAPAHVVGVSMGGMIGQMLAARRPDAVRSLVSIMSTTGSRRVGQPAAPTLRMLARRPPRSRDEAVERAVEMFRHIGSHGFPYDEARVRRVAGIAYDRGFNPAGTARQMAAILKSGDRTAALRAIRAPTLVLHGDRDRMVHPSGARATARAIPGARLETIQGMGHDLPAAACPTIVRAIAQHARAADAAASADAVAA